MAFCNDLCSSISGNCRECMTTPLTRKKVLIFGGIVVIIIIIIIIIAVSVHNASGSGVPPKGSDTIKNHPFILGGNAISALIKKVTQNRIKDNKLDPILSQGHGSIDELHKGYVTAQIWDLGASSCNDSQYKDAVSQTLDQIDLMLRIFKEYKNFTLITKSSEIQKAKTIKRIGTILRVDGGYTLDAKLSILRTYYNLGVRIMSLVGECDNPWGKSAWTKSEGGLEPFGKTIMGEMIRLGMIIDIAGASEKTQTDILDAAATFTSDKSPVPILLSHSGSKEIADSPNNVKPEILKKVKENGGLVLLSLNQTQVCGSKPDTTCNITNVIEHLNSLRTSMGGTDNIGIGGDFGTSSGKSPTDLDSPAHFVQLFDKLLLSKTPKWTQEQLKQIASENFINFFKKVEKIAASKVNVNPEEDLIDKTKLPPAANLTCVTDYKERYN